VPELSQRRKARSGSRCRGHRVCVLPPRQSSRRGEKRSPPGDGAEPRRSAPGGKDLFGGRLSSHRCPQGKKFVDGHQPGYPRDPALLLGRKRETGYRPDGRRAAEERRREKKFPCPRLLPETLCHLPSLETKKRSSRSAAVFQRKRRRLFSLPLPETGPYGSCRKPCRRS